MGRTDEPTGRPGSSAIAAAMAAIWIGLAPGLPARAHDIYTGVRDRSGYRCCGVEDCEAVGSSFVAQPDGAVLLHSRRFSAWIRIAPDRITWLVLPGGETSEAHWCGRPRSRAEAGLGQDQADDAFWTYCAFIAPQGS